MCLPRNFLIDIQQDLTSCATRYGSVHREEAVAASRLSYYHSAGGRVNTAVHEAADDADLARILAERLAADFADQVGWTLIQPTGRDAARRSRPAFGRTGEGT